jgi:hypothetical protein
MAPSSLLAARDAIRLDHVVRSLHVGQFFKIDEP